MQINELSEFYILKLILIRYKIDMTITIKLIMLSSQQHVASSLKKFFA